MRDQHPFQPSVAVAIVDHIGDELVMRVQTKVAAIRKNGNFVLVGDAQQWIEPTEKFEDLRREMNSLKFCREVHVKYATGAIAASEHMDPRKAEAQLGEAIDRVLLTWFGEHA